MSEYRNSDIHLRPRFKMNFDDSQLNLIKKFKDHLDNGKCNYCSTIVDGHITIDIPVEENHFWSPQLSIEIEQEKDGKTIVKGLFGPKPQVWTLFMFIHFAAAVAFIGFSIMAYVQWTLKSDYTFALSMVIGLPILWFALYFLGQIGKKTSHKQMNELHQFMMETLEKKTKRY